MHHRTVDVPGGRIHLVEEGDGPLVLLVHGFPETWYSWRHQIPALAAAGHRAVAIDVRGYGGSSSPADVAAYRMLNHVADNVAVVRALGAETAVIVGHDWGSPIAARSGLLRPDLFTAVGLLSGPYSPPGAERPAPPTDAGDELYSSYFQAPGRAEAELEADVRGWLAGWYAGLSGDTGGDRAGRLYFVSDGGTLRDRFPPGGELPAWLSAEDLDRYAAEFERTGFTGPLNRYRNGARDAEDLAPWNGEPLRQPSLFIAGSLEPFTEWWSSVIASHRTTLPGLLGSHVLEGCGHWVQQERADEVNALLIDWLAALPAH